MEATTGNVTHSCAAAREAIDSQTYCDQPALVRALIAQAALTAADRSAIHETAVTWVQAIRNHRKPVLMEVFLAEYGLSTDEGIALMCLAEAVLRVPDGHTLDALLEDKITPSDWSKHLGHSTSPLVNASTWSLMLTGKVLKKQHPGVTGSLRAALKRLGEPVIRSAVSRAMKEMGRQFVLGETITAAMSRAQSLENAGYTYSYDMLGEAAWTHADATRYYLSYSKTISAIADACTHEDIRRNPGISIKLSALHPRYELTQTQRVMDELVPRLRSLALLAKSAGMGLNLDAEEADRLALSLEVIEAVLSDPALKGWEGFGVVVQAYSKRASFVIDYLYKLATKLERKIMVRLVKGAYWDTEIKRAQVEGLAHFPVFTSKAATDVAYIAHARQLLSMTDRIYPQFATHNAHTAAAVMHMAPNRQCYEFQRLHGMGEALHDWLLKNQQTRCRIYAPVGTHRDLLAYLVRRLLENGANSSFVHQIMDANIAPEVVAQDPFDAYAQFRDRLPRGTDLFMPERINSRGFDLQHRPTLQALERERAPFKNKIWSAAPLLAVATPCADAVATFNPAKPSEQVGNVSWASQEHVAQAIRHAKPWDAPKATRAAVLNTAADALERRYAELFALISREAGKTQQDCVAELREGVDFLRYYAARIPDSAPIGIFACIAPWNFPLAIFTGQVAAALAAGNAVLAKPAEQTPLIAQLVVECMHQAGVPKTALQLLPGAGDIGAQLCADPRIGGVAFTGSIHTAWHIHRSMAQSLSPGAPFIAETGGLNAMIVDSTALPEQAVAAVIQSAFQSAGQRCSALRCLYVQRDIAPAFTQMLIGAMNEFSLGDPWDFSTDLGPVIDRDAQAAIASYVHAARTSGRVLAELSAPDSGSFVAPTLIQVNGIEDIKREVFGPILHLAQFEGHQWEQIIQDINATGYGLTFGLQTRIDDRVQYVTDHLAAGNLYINRNQIGAIVGSQPFGGQGLSGTGPKAGGPLYLSRFAQCIKPNVQANADTPPSLTALQRALDHTEHGPQHSSQSLPGPTGESNRLSTHARAPILCAGPSAAVAAEQAQAIEELGGCAVIANDIAAEDLHSLKGYSALVYWGDTTQARAYAIALSQRPGPIVPLITTQPDRSHVLHERHLCVDTTASGGNVALLSTL